MLRGGPRVMIIFSKQRWKHCAVWLAALIKLAVRELQLCPIFVSHGTVLNNVLRQLGNNQLGILFPA